MSGYEGNIRIVGPEGENVAWGCRPKETFSYSGATIHLLPESQSITVLLYPSLICFEQPVTLSFVSYQTTSLSALNFGCFRSVEFRWKLISCNVAVKQMRCWTGRHVNIEIVRPDEITFVLLEFLLVRIIKKNIHKGITIRFKHQDRGIFTQK